MTVEQWITSRTPSAPVTLTALLLELLGAAGHAPANRTSEVCLETAARALDRLVVEKRFARDSALELLAIDALTTYAFEHASQVAATPKELEALAGRGTLAFAAVADRA